MSDFLFITPPDWTRQDRDTIVNATGFDESSLTALQGGNMSDLNERLEAAGYFPDERRVVDVLVLDAQIFFRIE